MLYRKRIYYCRNIEGNFTWNRHFSKSIWREIWIRFFFALQETDILLSQYWRKFYVKSTLFKKYLAGNLNLIFFLRYRKRIYYCRSIEGNFTWNRYVTGWIQLRTNHWWGRWRRVRNSRFWRVYGNDDWRMIFHK